MLPPRTAPFARLAPYCCLGIALLIVGIFSVWANRLLFNPDNWSNTSTQLLSNPTIRSSTANYLVDQLYANVNVPGPTNYGNAAGQNGQMPPLVTNPANP